MKDNASMINPVLRIADKNTLSRKNRIFKEDTGQHSVQKKIMPISAFRNSLCSVIQLAFLPAYNPN